jgi:hypothetical protein
MTVYSVLGPGGVPRPPLGSFAGKGSKTFAELYSVLSPGGYPKEPYSSFAKVGSKTFKQVFSVLSAGGYPMPPRTFTAKPQPTPIIVPQGGGGKRHKVLGITPEEWILLMAALEDD